jgi:2-phosphoglycerate kinase
MDDLKRKLAHVYWIGGSPCSGKSSIVDLLAKKNSSTNSVSVYHCDDYFDEHLQLTTPEKQPSFYRVRGMSWDDLWMRPVPEQIEHELAIYREQFWMIVADLLRMPDDKPILVEGAALLPELVTKVVVQPNRAFFVVPTPEFQWRTYEKRPWIHHILDQCRDPEQAFQNWMERDVGYGEYVAKTAVSLDYSVIHVDGSRTIAENAAQVAQHFAW